MEHLQQGAEAFIPGDGLTAQINVEITPHAEFDYELVGVSKHVKRADSVYARGFEQPAELVIRPRDTAQFAAEAQAHVIIEFTPQAGPSESVELQRFKIAGLSEFTPATLTPAPGGVSVKAGQVEQLADGQSRVYTEIVREITPETGETDNVADAGLALPRSVLVYIDQSASMVKPNRTNQMRAVSKFLSEFLSKLEIELSVAGSSATSTARRVHSSADALEAMLALTPRAEVGWPSSLSAALKRYDRAIVVSGDLPAEASDPRVTLITFDNLPDRFNGVEFGPVIQAAVENDDHAKLKQLSTFLQDRLYSQAGSEPGREANR